MLVNQLAPVDIEFQAKRRICGPKYLRLPTMTS